MYTHAMATGPIVVVGGLTARPRDYRGFAEVLRGLSGADVYVVPLTPVDWAVGYLRGYGQLVFEIATAVDRALLESGADRAALVGHSAGGVAARVYLGGDPPFGGRRYSGHRYVKDLITLGSPHVVSENKGLNLIHRTNELFPGALHKESGLRYLSVAGDAVDGAASRKARRRYERLAEDGRVAGDGVVPVEAALLPGSEGVVLDGVCHNRHFGRWYGSDRETVERWWPEELRAKEDLIEKGANAG